MTEVTYLSVRCDDIKGRGSSCISAFHPAGWQRGAESEDRHSLARHALPHVLGKWG